MSPLRDKCETGVKVTPQSITEWLDTSIIITKALERKSEVSLSATATMTSEPNVGRQLTEKREHVDANSHLQREFRTGLSLTSSNGEKLTVVPCRSEQTQSNLELVCSKLSQMEVSCGSGGRRSAGSFLSAPSYLLEKYSLSVSQVQRSQSLPRGIDD